MAFATQEYSIIGVKHAAIMLVVDGTPDTIVENDILFARNVNYEPQVQTITFEGDDVREDRDILNGLNITVQADKFDLATISNAYGKQVVTASLPDGVAGRIYFGDSGELSVLCGVVSEVDAKNEATGDIETLRMVVPKATLKVFQPRALQYNTKAGTEFRFSALKTAVDLLNVALPGVPAGGAFWYLDQMETA
jgi:hypothetical protein